MRLGTHVFTAMEYSADRSSFRWNVVSLPGEPPPAQPISEKEKSQAMGARKDEHAANKSFAEPPPRPQTPHQALARIEFPQDAIERISQLIVPGSSLIISDHGLGEETGEGTDFIVVVPSESRFAANNDRRSAPAGRWHQRGRIGPKGSGARSLAARDSAADLTPPKTRRYGPHPRLQGCTERAKAYPPCNRRHSTEIGNIYVKDSAAQSLAARSLAVEGGSSWVSISHLSRRTVSSSAPIAPIRAERPRAASSSFRKSSASIITSGRCAIASPPKAMPPWRRRCSIASSRISSAAIRRTKSPMPASSSPIPIGAR